MHDNCIACQATQSLNDHWEAIFQFLDEHDIEYGDLPFIRMDIHNHFRRKPNV